MRDRLLRDDERTRLVPVPPRVALARRFLLGLDDVMEETDTMKKETDTVMEETDTVMEETDAIKMEFLIYSDVWRLDRTVTVTLSASSPEWAIELAKGIADRCIGGGSE